MSKPTAHLRKARDCQQRADWDGALEALLQAVQSDARNPTIHNQIGDIYLRKDDVESACEHFERAIELYAELGLHNNAVALCRKVIRLSPGRLEVRWQLARLRLDQGLRSEGLAFFEDYIDHVTPDSEHVGPRLEERCKEIVERHPEEAPVSRILEKLEETQSVAAAAEIVQRLAQRAADAGEDEVARRFTEKLRSLRVLLERLGQTVPDSGTPLGPGAAVVDLEPTAPPMPDRAAAAPPHRAPSPPGPPTAATVPGGFLDPGAIELPAEDAPAGAGPPVTPAPEADPVPPVSAGPPPETPTPVPAVDPTPELDLPGELEVAPPGSAAEASAIEIDANAPAVSEEVPGAAHAGEDETEVPEYEIADVSLDEVAALLDEGAAPALPEATDPTEPQVAETRVEGRDSVAPPTAAASTAELDALEADKESSEDDRGELFDVLGFDPSGSAAEGHADARAGVPAAPVWIPGAQHPEPDPVPDGNGETHQLEDVIDHFREQMAKALGDDGPARYDLGVAYFEMGLYNEALAEFEAASRVSGYREQSLEMMAACLAKQERHEEILELLEPVLQAEDADAPELLGLRYAVGCACAAVGRPQEARAHFERLARVDAGFKDVAVRLRELGPS